MALRGSRHGMILFPPVTPINVSDAELLHDRMKSQLFLFPFEAVVNFPLPAEDLPLFLLGCCFSSTVLLQITASVRSG